MNTLCKAIFIVRKAEADPMRLATTSPVSQMSMSKGMAKSFPTFFSFRPHKMKPFSRLGDDCLAVQETISIPPVFNTARRTHLSALTIATIAQLCVL